MLMFHLWYRETPACLNVRHLLGVCEDKFVDNFITLAQQYGNGRLVRRTLLHNIDNALCPLNKHNNVFCCKPVSLKKLLKRDCLWNTVQNVLRWIIDTVNMTVHFLPHRAERLAIFLESIYTHWLEVKTCQKVAQSFRRAAINGSGTAGRPSFV